MPDPAAIAYRFVSDVVTLIEPKLEPGTPALINVAQPLASFATLG